jgi:hypothetical protein
MRVLARRSRKLTEIRGSRLCKTAATLVEKVYAKPCGIMAGAENDRRIRVVLVSEVYVGIACMAMCARRPAFRKLMKLN